MFAFWLAATRSKNGLRLSGLLLKLVIKEPSGCRRLRLDYGGLLPPPALGERHHRGLARWLITACRCAIFVTAEGGRYCRA
jgi:hypothetical protein